MYFLNYAIKKVSKLNNKNLSIKISELSNGTKNESNFVQGSIEKKILRKVQNSCYTLEYSPQIDVIAWRNHAIYPKNVYMHTATQFAATSPIQPVHANGNNSTTSSRTYFFTEDP